MFPLLAQGLMLTSLHSHTLCTALPHLNLCTYADFVYLLVHVQNATFKGKGDKEIVPNLCKSYMERTADVMQDTLALKVETVSISIPSMPPVHLDPTREDSVKVYSHTQDWNHEHAVQLSGVRGLSTFHNTCSSIVH